MPVDTGEDLWYQGTLEPTETAQNVELIGVAWNQISPNNVLMLCWEGYYWLLGQLKDVEYTNQQVLVQQGHSIYCQYQPHWQCPLTRRLSVSRFI